MTGVLHVEISGYACVEPYVLERESTVPEEFDRRAPLAAAQSAADNVGMGVSATDNPFIEQLRDLLDRQPGLACAYLFGSVARGAATGTSDVDLAVLLELATEDTLHGPLARLHLDLEDALGRPVDLVAMDTAPPDLIHRVLRDGILLVDRNPNRRIAFEVRARNNYFDLLPYLTEYRRAGFA